MKSEVVNSDRCALLVSVKMNFYSEVNQHKDELLL